MNKQKKQKPTIIRSISDLAQIKALIQDETAGESGGLDTESPFQQRADFNELRKPTYRIVSIVAYLLGVDKRHFDNEHEPPQPDAYAQLEKDKEARIIRNLSIIRTAMEQKYTAISLAFYQEGKNIGSMPELIPFEPVQTLYEDGASIYMGNPRIDDYLIRINQEISNRISTVARLFPEWVKWEYVKPIFLMPNGTKLKGIKDAGEIYNADRKRYPYQCWLNWDAIGVGAANKGNILFSDEKFLTLLYERHEDHFENLSLVRDVGNQVMRNLGDMLSNCRKCIIVVDCENSDAVKLAAALSSLPKRELSKISKVLLFDSEYTTPQWSKLVDKSMKTVRDSLQPADAAASLRLEHIVVRRLNQSKSQVDMTLAVRTSREVFANNVDGVILVSSDSDYWALIKQLEGVHFLVMLEKEKTGLPIMNTLALHNIRYCFLDDFCTGASYLLKTETLIDAIQGRINAILSGESRETMNVKSIMDSCLHESWIEMTNREKEAFFDRYLRKMKLVVQPDGMVAICIQ